MEGNDGRLFTQEEVNTLIAADRRKDRAELGALRAQIAAVADRADEFERTVAEQGRPNGSESLQAELLALEERVSAEERHKAAVDAARSVAEELGYPSNGLAEELATWLKGDTREEMEAQARHIIDIFRPEAEPWGGVR